MVSNRTKVVLLALSVFSLAIFGLRYAFAAPASGDLVKTNGSSVYYIGVDSKRYVFPNEKVYFSWYKDFSSVKTISDSELASYMIGGNVTYKPGTRLVKIQSDPKVYAVSANGVLRWVPDENTASTIYGANWNRMIDDIPDSFFVNYKMGTDIGPTQRYDRTQELANATNIGTDKHLLSGVGSQQNINSGNNNNFNVPAFIPPVSSGGGGGGGSSPNINTNSNTNLNTNSNFNANSNTNTNANSNSNSNSNTNTNTNSNSNSNTNTNANTNTNTNSNSNSNSNSNLNTNTNTNTNQNSNSNINTNTNTNSNQNTNTNTGTNSDTVQLISRDIKDTSGKTIVARGAEMVVADTYDSDWIDAAANDGANAVRLLLTLDAANNMTPATFDTLVGRAVSHNMIVWISLFTWDGTHNNVIGSALGGGNFYSLTAPDGTGTCSSATPAPCYLAVWSRPWLKNLIAKYKGNIIIDGMQEYIGTADPDTEAGRTEWATVAKANIQWFRNAGYIEPLEIMSSYQGRDLDAIVEKGSSIRAVDTVQVNGYPQTMFGWQAYWADSWYKGWQGNLLLGGNNTITGAQAVHQFVANQTFPIEVGVDNYGGDTALEYQAEIDQAAADNVSWLWWSWGDAGVECPVNGAACKAYVTGSQSGFAGAAR